MQVRLVLLVLLIPPVLPVLPVLLVPQLPPVLSVQSSIPHFNSAHNAIAQDQPKGRGIASSLNPFEIFAIWYTSGAPLNWS